MRTLLKYQLLAAFSLASAPAVHAVVVDDFSGDLSNYSSTVILDANGGGSNTASWQISGGGLQYVTTAYDGIEQTAFILNGLTLAVGEEIQVDLTHSGASQDIGLYVGGSAPVTGSRANYVNVYARGAAEIYSRGFLGSTEIILNGGAISEPSFDRLFIARDGVNDYELGYYNGSTRVVIADRNDMTDNDGEFVGFYTDVRATGTLGTLDNFTLVPEPSVALLGGLGILGLLRRRRA